jgi:DNA-binding NarL/FixJ family response regulator
VIVLLVDDEPWYTDALAAKLESEEFVCLKATNMTEGVKALQEHQVTVLVTDIMMPPGDAFRKVDADEAGFHFIEYVQQHWPNLPIVCLSVIGDLAKIHSLKSRGVRYLRKGETPLSTAVKVITAVATGKRIRL